MLAACVQQLQQNRLLIYVYAQNLFNIKKKTIV